MLLQEIQTELDRLQIHPVNLHVSGTDDDKVVLAGSLLPFWSIPQVIGGEWLLTRLKGLPMASGPKATMDALFPAHAEEAPRGA